MVDRPKSLSVTLALTDAALIVACYVGTAYLLDPIRATVLMSIEQGFLKVSLLAGLILVLAYFHNLYTELRVLSRVKLVLDFVNVFGFAIVVESILTYTRVNVSLPPGLMIAGSAALLVVLPGWHMLYGRVLCRLARERVLIVGVTPISLEIARGIATYSGRGWTLAGFAGDDPEAVPADAVWLGPVSALPEILSRTRPHLVLAAGVEVPAGLVSGGVRVEPAEAVYETICNRVYITPEGAIPRPFQGGGSRSGILAVQSIYTNLLALALVLASVPVMLLIALAIRLTSPGPAILGQACVGMQRIPFLRLRFRSYREHRGADGSVERTPTWIGRLLTRYQLVGMPQSLNVLRGEMSLVGPEPERVEFSNALARLIPAYELRYAVKPGMVGWSQVSCQRQVPEDTITRLEYDLYYVKHFSPALDIIVLLRWFKSLLAA